jgi:uncharacterized protein (UPF0335 family)
MGPCGHRQTPEPLKFPRGTPLLLKWGFHHLRKIISLSSSQKEILMSDKKTTNYDVTAEELTQFVERGERLNKEKKDISEQEKELYAEAKGRGYDAKVLKKVIVLRARDPKDVAEEEAVMDMYKKALKMS